MKFFLILIFILFYSINCEDFEIDNFLTPPYQEMNFKDNDIENVIFYFTQEVNKSDFTEIYLTNSTNKLTLFKGNKNINYCLFKKKMVKCICLKEENNIMVIRIILIINFTIEISSKIYDEVDEIR